MVILAGLLNILINTYQYYFLEQRDLVAIISNLFLITVGISFFKVGQRLQNPETLGAILVLVAATLICLNWASNQGSQGTLPLWFAPVILFTASMFRGRLLIGVSIYLLAAIISVLGMEALRPEWIQSYVSTEAQLFDKGTVLLVAAIICFTLTLFINIAYREEKDRAIKLAIENHQKELLLNAAHQETEQLRSLLPICAWCRKIENVDGSWSDFESYLLNQQKTDLTHGICPECVKNKGVN